MDEDATTLRAAKEWLRQRVEEGARCPCCRQIAKVYKRKLHSGMAMRLISCYRISVLRGFDWIDVNELYKQGPSVAPLDFPYLRFWGLIEKHPTDRDSEVKSSGLWRITELGVDFVCGRAEVFSHIRFYDSRFLGFTGERIRIGDALGEKFNYRELMAV